MTETNQEDTHLSASRNVILIVDDEVKIRKFLKLNLQDKYRVFQAKNGLEALSTLQHEEIDLVVTDLRMPEMSGMDLIRRIRETGSEIPIVIMTAYGSIENAVEAMKNGAHDYILKPLKLDQLELIIKKSIDYGNLKNENLRLKTQLKKYEDFPKIISVNSGMRKLLDLVKQVAPTSVPVLIEGESGTGKELFARALHFMSPRAEKPFIEINCGAMPSELIESELFGHEKGAFTGATAMKKGKFEIADQGTLFLDEIVELPRDLQVKLLKAIEEQRFTRVGGVHPIQTNLRIIAATNRSLSEEIKTGNFREDLYYRLNVVNFMIPPLRERKDDIPHLVQYFLKKHEKTVGKKIQNVDKETLEILQDYQWKGNVRELENLITRAMIFSQGNILTRNSLPEELKTSSLPSNFSIPHTKEELQQCKKQKYYEIDADLEYGFLSDIMKKTAGNISEAARLAGYDRRQIQNMLNKHHLNPENFRK